MTNKLRTHVFNAILLLKKNRLIVINKNIIAMIDYAVLCNLGEKNNCRNQIIDRWAVIEGDVRESAKRS